MKAPGGRQLAALKVAPHLYLEDILRLARATGAREKDGGDISERRAWLLTLAGISCGSGIREYPAFPSRTLIEYMWQSAPAIQVRAKGSGGRYRVMLIGGVVVMRAAVASRKGVALGIPPEEYEMAWLDQCEDSSALINAPESRSDPWDGMESSRSSSERTRKRHKREAAARDGIPLKVLDSPAHREIPISEGGLEPHEKRAADLAAYFQKLEKDYRPRGAPRMFVDPAEAIEYGGSSPGKKSPVKGSFACPSLAAYPHFDFCAAALNDVKLPEPRFQYAQLGGVDMHSSRIKGGDLRGSAFAGADLSGAVFISTDLRYADMRASFPCHGVRFLECRLDEAVLESALLGTWTLERCSLKNANLRKAVFSPSRGLGISTATTSNTGTSLRGSSFETADLREAAFAGSFMEGCIFRGATLDGADFREADLREADLRGARGIRKAFWKGADLRGALMERESSVLVGLMGAIVEPPPDESGSSESAC